MGYGEASLATGGPHLGQRRGPASPGTELTSKRAGGPHEQAMPR